MPLLNRLANNLHIGAQKAKTKAATTAATYREDTSSSSNDTLNVTIPTYPDREDTITPELAASPDDIQMFDSPSQQDNTALSTLEIPTKSPIDDPEMTASPSDMDITPIAPRARRPFMLDRLPSDALSSSSELSESEPDTPSIPVSRVSAAALTAPLELIPSPDPNDAPTARPAVQQPAPSIQRKHTRIPSIEIHSTPSSQPLSRSSSTVSDPSTPHGFLAHRRTSSATRPHQVKETLSAHLSHDHESDSDSDTSHIGCRRLNQYRLGPLLGAGSAGSVEKAINTEDGQEYAVKELSKSRLRKRKRSEALRVSRGRGRPKGVHEMGEDEKVDALSLIRTEVAIMKKLDHPNLVKLFEVLDVPEGDSLYMVMELCSGGPVTSIALESDDEDLTPHIPLPTGGPKRKTTCEIIPEDVARNYFRQMLLAVEYLHLNDIVHRDIKPENILLMENKEVCKICDFGVSEMFVKHGDDTSTKHVGSPAFMSPELCLPSLSHSIHARATDIWALGVTLYCLVVGKLPFQSANFLRLNELISNVPVRIPHRLSQELRDMLAKMMDKDPNTRITTQQLREHPWVTNGGSEPLPSSEDNAGYTSLTPTSQEVESAVTHGSFGDILSAKKMARILKRNVGSRAPQRGQSLQVDGSSSFSDHQRDHSASSSMSNFSDRQAAFNESPEGTQDFSHSRDASRTNSMNVQKSSMDDLDLDTVRYVEKQTGQDAVRRDSDLSLPSRSNSRMEQ